MFPLDTCHPKETNGSRDPFLKFEKFFLFVILKQNSIALWRKRQVLIPPIVSFQQ